MFGKKKKKQPKVEKAIKGSSEEEQVLDAENKTDELVDKNQAAIDDFLGQEETPEDDYLTEKQRLKVEKLNSVKSKISQILKSQNIEIVDENIGDEYEMEGSAEGEAKSQQDYDSLKALFGDKDKGKSNELTLTIDDFDYTYVGQYLDEFDLMHMKNIKRIRLQRKYPKHLKKILIISSIVLVAGLGAFLGYYFTREVPVYLKNVTLNQTEHDYYIDDWFDYTGLYLIEEYSDGTKKQVKLEKEHLSNTLGLVYMVGDDGKDVQFGNGSVATLTFTYQGFDVDYTVNVLKKEEKGLQAIYGDDLFNLKQGEYISDDILKVMVDYGAYGKQRLALSNSGLSLYVGNTKCTYEKSKGFKMTSNVTTESKIKIIYKSITLTIEYVEGKNVVSITK